MKKYIKTFSRREVLSALFSALMIIFSFFVASSVLIIIDNVPTFYILWGVLILTSLALSHRFYLLEHRRSNSLGGRILHGCLIAVFLFVIFFVLFCVIGFFYHSFGYVSNLILFIVVLIFTSEMILSLINLLLKLLKWRVW